MLLDEEGEAVSKPPMRCSLDDDTIRGWRKLFERRGIEGITSFDAGWSASYLSVKQEDDLKAWAGAALPRSIRGTGAWTLKESGRVYESRPGLIALASSGARGSQAGRRFAQARRSDAEGVHRERR